MNKKAIALLITAVSLTASLHAADKVYAKWDFTLASNLGKNLTQIGSTASMPAGEGKTWYTWVNSTTFETPGNFQNSQVFNSSQGYSLRQPNAAGQIVGAQTGMTAADRTGQVYMIIDFASWNLPNVTSTISMNFDAGARSGVRLRATGDKVYLDFWAGNPWQTGGAEFALSMEDVRIAIEYDYANNNNATVLYSVGGGEWVRTSLTSLGRATGQIDYIKWGQVGQLGEIDGELYGFDIRSITVANTLAIPEPSTYALAAGVLTLGVVAVARRRSSKR